MLYSVQCCTVYSVVQCTVYSVVQCIQHCTMYKCTEFKCVYKYTAYKCTVIFVLSTGNRFVVAAHVNVAKYFLYTLSVVIGPLTGEHMAILTAMIGSTVINKFSLVCI